MKVEFNYLKAQNADEPMPALFIETGELFKARIDEKELVSFKTAADIFIYSYGINKRLTREECIDIINKATLNDNTLILSVVSQDGKAVLQMMYANIKTD